MALRLGGFVVAVLACQMQRASLIDAMQVAEEPSTTKTTKTVGICSSAAPCVQERSCTMSCTTIDLNAGAFAAGTQGPRRRSRRGEVPLCVGVLVGFTRLYGRGVGGGLRGSSLGCGKLVMRPVVCVEANHEKRALRARLVAKGHSHRLNTTAVHGCIVRRCTVARYGGSCQPTSRALHTSVLFATTTQLSAEPSGASAAATTSPDNTPQQHPHSRASWTRFSGFYNL